MADNHREVDESLYHARQLMDPLRNATASIARLDDLLASMHQMKDGNGTEATHFQKIVDLFGVKGADANAKLANAKVIYDEMNSALAPNNSAAIRQFLAIMG